MKTITITIALLLIAACSLCPYSLDDYNNIQEGQTLIEVETLLDGKGERLSHWEVDSIQYSEYKWSENSYGSIYVDFADSIVIHKWEFNLK